MNFVNKWQVSHVSCSYHWNGFSQLCEICRLQALHFTFVFLEEDLNFNLWPFCSTGGCLAVTKPLADRSCDPPCTKPLSLCTEVSHSISLQNSTTLVVQIRQKMSLCVLTLHIWASVCLWITQQMMFSLHWLKNKISVFIKCIVLVNCWSQMSGIVVLFYSTVFYCAYLYPVTLSSSTFWQMWRVLWTSHQMGLYCLDSSAYVSQITLFSTLSLGERPQQVHQ